MPLRAALFFSQVGWEAYAAKLSSFGILVKVRNFLVFQVRRPFLSVSAAVSLAVCIGVHGSCFSSVLFCVRSSDGDAGGVLRLRVQAAEC